MVLLHERIVLCEQGLAAAPRIDSDRRGRRGSCVHGPGSRSRRHSPRLLELRRQLADALLGRAQLRTRFFERLARGWLRLRRRREASGLRPDAGLFFAEPGGQRFGPRFGRNRAARGFAELLVRSRRLVLQLLELLGQLLACALGLAGRVLGGAKLEGQLRAFVADLLKLVLEGLFARERVGQIVPRQRFPLRRALERSESAASRAASARSCLGAASCCSMRALSLARVSTSSCTRRAVSR